MSKLTISIDHSSQDYTVVAFKLGDEVQLLQGYIAEDIWNMLGGKMTRNEIVLKKKTLVILNEHYGQGWSIEDGFQDAFWAKTGPRTFAWFDTLALAKSAAERA